MARKQTPPPASEKITATANEIFVAKSGFLKPYATGFQYLPDNIAREPLGMLAGALAIDDRSETSGYIVNFLASLAKKEYYLNPRRPAIESFEAALHKVNLGLSELAKEGNTEWIGTLNAAVCAVERNNLHFSVAGKAKVLLLRDRRLSVISDGLVETGEYHPMKTFTDVASGKICAGDRILITTPELFSAISEPELERSAARLDREGLERFLETAVVNRLDLSASVLIDIQAIAEYARPAAPKRPLASPSSVPNAWSLTAFEFSKQTGMSVEAGLEAREEAEREKERIDEKTGHIYITGDSIEEPRREEWERVRLISEEWKERLGAIFRRGMRSMREYVATRKKRREERLSLPSPQEVTSEAVQIHTRETSPKEATMHPSETFPTEKSEKIFPPLEEESLESESAPERDVVEKRAEVSIDSAILPPEHSANNTISFLKYFAKPFFGALVSNLSKHSRTVAHSVPRFFSRKTVHVPVREETPSTLSSLFRPLFFFFPRLEKEAKRAWNFWNLLSPTKRRLLQGIMLLTLFAIIGFVIFLLTKDAPPLPEEPSSLKENPASPSPLTTEKNIRFLKNPTTLFEGERILSIVRLKEFRLVITETALFRLGEPGSTAEKVPYPEGREAKKGVAMLDLNALILLMKDGTIRFYTPVNNRFANESFSLPNSSGTAALGAYMTYLYVANFEQNSITRLPRSEGGFASGVSWLKEPVEIDEQTSLALGEFLYLAHPSDIRVYSRGTLQNISFEKPALVPDITALSLPDLESTSLFALDQKEGRIFEYRKDTGAILAQYAHESLKGGKNFTVDTKNRNALVNTETHVFSFSLDEHSLLSH